MAALSWQDLELGDVIGAGQSAVVIKARLRRPVAGLPEGSVVAVKRYKQWVLEQPGQLERIFREFDAGRTVHHENLVLVLGVLIDDGGRPALVMRYYDGPTLEDVLGKARRDKAALPVASGFRILRGLASAIDALHQNSIIHRDIKPGNVIMTGNGPVLADLGVIRSDSWPEQTTAGVFLGTIRYAAPEYLFGEAYDHRIDLYSFGAISYEVLVGRQFFERQQNWARLVAAKVTTHAMITRSRRVERLISKAKSLIEAVLEHTICPADRRDLDLGSFVCAMDHEWWDIDVSIENGHLVPRVETARQPGAVRQRRRVRERPW